MKRTSVSRLRFKANRWLLAGLMVFAMIPQMASSEIAKAAGICYPGTVKGRLCYRGYFTGVQDGYGTDVWPEIMNGQALPSATINSADSLMDLLVQSYNSGDGRRSVGAAFIYNTMMGYNAPGIGGNISPAQWNELRTRLRGLDQAGKISWNLNVSGVMNSYYQGTDRGANPNDDAFYHEYKNEPGIIIRDYNNNVIYEILRRCANPLGDLPGGIPPARNYVLTPRVDSVTPGQVEAGSRITVQTSVNNDGNVASNPTQWEITQMTVQPGQRAPHEDAGAITISGNAPCGNHFANGVSQCRNVARGNDRFNLGRPAQNVKPRASGVEVADLPVGTRVCFALSVQPRGSSDNRWAHSRPVCVVVGKKPKVQVQGHDLAVRGQIRTSTSVKGARTYGSWVEYGAFSVGTNTMFGSGAGLANAATNSQASWSRLTFANQNNSGGNAFGNYTTAANFRPVPPVAEFFDSVPNKQGISGNVNLGSATYDNRGDIRVRTAGNLNITGGSIPRGRSVVIQATGTVTISGNITYTDDDLSSPLDIPQVVIIANNINIRDSVNRVDAWLIARGTTNTCSNFSGNLTSNKCNDLLRVNGPVITNRLLLNRTAGSNTGAQSGDPAERFNLRPDAFLWAQSQASGANKAQTVRTTELPPRF